MTMARFPLLRRGQVLIGLIGAGGTTAFLLLAKLFDDGGGSQRYLSFFGFVQILICLPAIKVFSLFGKKFLLSDNDGSGPGYDSFALCSVVLINGLLLATLAIIIFCLAKQLKKQITS